MVKVFVTTDNDYFNSADEARFHLAKGQVKPLPENITPIIQSALEQGLLREATEEEIRSYEIKEGVKLLSDEKEQEK